MLDGTVIEQGATERVSDDPDDDRARALVRGELVYQTIPGRTRHSIG
jgi:ABC-type phosphonate transport system ATPase subunit|nr:hypothetical protein [Haloglomus irregulare]